MTFITSRISFGAYNFPAGFYLDYRQQDSTVDIVKLPYQDGSNIPPGTRSEKYISIKGMLGGIGAVDSSGNYILTRDQLEAEANLMASSIEGGYQQLVVGAITNPRYLTCQKTKFKTTYEPGTGQTVLNVEIEFVAQDPRWIAQSGSSSTSLTGTLTSNGTQYTWPKFTITAASANASLTITPSGYGGIKLALVNSLISSGSLVIDTDPRNRANAVLLNGVLAMNLLDYTNTQNNNGDSSFFPYLRPGANTIAVSGITGMTTSWFDAWLF